MPQYEDYEIENLILQVKDELDLKLKELRIGSSMLGTKIYQKDRAGDDIKQINNILSKISDVLKDEESISANTKDLLKISFGEGTRLKSWLNPQNLEKGRELFSTYEKIALHFSAPRSAAELSNFNPNVDKTNQGMVSQLLNVEKEQAHKLSLAIPFLKRMIASDNFSKKDSVVVNTFYENLNNFRNSMIELEGMQHISNEEELTEYYKSTAYQKMQQSLSNLVYDYKKISPLITKANNMAEGSDRFNWHLGDSVNLCFDALNKLDRNQKLIELIKKIPDKAQQEELLTIKNDSANMFKAQLFIRAMIENIKNPQDKINTALRLISHFDNDLPILPQKIKDNPQAQQGCLQELLITARPNLFAWSKNNNELILKDKSVLVDSILKGEHSQDLDPELNTILRSIHKSTFRIGTDKEKINAYVDTINLLAKDKLNMHSSEQPKSGREQAKEVAEKLAWHRFVGQRGILETDQQTTLNKSLSSDPLKRAAKSFTQTVTGQKPGEEDISKWTVQRLFRDTAKVVQQSANQSINPSETFALRIKQKYTKDIQLFANLAAQINVNNDLTHNQASVKTKTPLPPSYAPPPRP